MQPERNDEHSERPSCNIRIPYTRVICMADFEPPLATVDESTARIDERTNRRALAAALFAPPSPPPSPLPSPLPSPPGRRDGVDVSTASPLGGCGASALTEQPRRRLRDPPLGCTSPLRSLAGQLGAADDRERSRARHGAGPEALADVQPDHALLAELAIAERGAHPLSRPSELEEQLSLAAATSLPAVRAVCLRQSDAKEMHLLFDLADTMGRVREAYAMHTGTNASDLRLYNDDEGSRYPADATTAQSGLQDGDCILVETMKTGGGRSGGGKGGGGGPSLRQGKQAAQPKKRASKKAAAVSDAARAGTRRATEPTEPAAGAADATSNPTSHSPSLAAANEAAANEAAEAAEAASLAPEESEEEAEVGDDEAASSEAIAARSDVRRHLEDAIKRGIEDKGSEALRQAMVAAGVRMAALDPRKLFEPIMQAYVASLRTGSSKEAQEQRKEMNIDRGFAAKAKKALDEELLYLDLARLRKLEKQSAPVATGNTEAARKVVYSYFREHVVEVADCEKCVATRGSQEIRAAYATEGVNGKASKALSKRACCFWAHSLSAAQLTERAMGKYAATGLTKPVALALAKEFMAAKTTPLGQPHATQSKFDYQVTLYAEDGLGHVRAVNSRGELCDAFIHRHVYMGYHWQDTSTGAGSSSGVLPEDELPPLVGGHR